MQGWDCCSSRQPVVVCAPGPVYDWGTKAAAVLLHFIKNGGSKRGICLLKVQYQYDGNLFCEVTFLWYISRDARALGWQPLVTQ